jgi:phosphoribosyl 1,2-cyclic phosphodiesterase
MGDDVKIRFWGVRGSIPSPGPKTIRYGGNTTCIEVETDDGQTIILDAGTGIHALAQSLLKKLPLSCSIFLTHTHWDHIQGLPFFIPIFIPMNQIKIYGAFDPVLQRDIRDVLSRQMEYCYFPVREAELKADLHYSSLAEGQTLEIGSAKVTNIIMNHTVINFGYRIECNGKSVFFTGDHEPLYNIYHPGDDYFEEYENLITQKNALLADFIGGVDMLIADSAYTEQEYPAKKGWGHGTYDKCREMAAKAGAKALYFTHHEPQRSDEELDDIQARLNKTYSDVPAAVPCRIASEGLEIVL